MIELLFDIPGQSPTLRHQVILERRVVFLDKLVKQRALHTGVENPTVSRVVGLFLDALPPTGR